MKLTRLSIQEFDKLATTTRLRERAREMARAVLVDGRTQTDVAAEYGMTKNRISLAVHTIRRAYLRTAGPGGGVVSVSLDLPELLALELGNLSDAIQNCVDDALVESEVEKLIKSINGTTQHLK